MVEEENNYGISYVSCFHAQGVVVDLSYKSLMIGTHLMDKNHNNSVYGFFSYKFYVDNRMVIHMGPLYRMNNDRQLLIGQYGIDYKLYGPINLTSRVLQIRRDLNYLNVGVKVTL